MFSTMWSLLKLVFAEDPVDRWLLGVCRNIGIDCTPTWGKLISITLAVVVGLIISFTIRRYQRRWKVTAWLPEFERHLL